MLPNLFLVGAMKAGTTSLASALSHHPEIFCCPIKEPNYFARELHENGVHKRFPSTRHFDIAAYLEEGVLPQKHYAYVERQDDYMALFREARGEKYLLDASTSYLSSPVAAELIATMSPDAKIVIVTREKSSRAWSEFRMNMQIGLATTDFRSALEREAQQIMLGRVPLVERYVTTGWYRHHTARFIKYFGEENVFVVDMVDMVRDSRTFFNSLCTVLGIKTLDIEIPRENAQVEPRFPMLNRALYASGVKYVGSKYAPAGVVRIAKEWLAARRPQAMPTEFSRVFWEYYSKLSPEEDREIQEEKLTRW